MGWASGNRLFLEIIQSAKKHIPDPKIRKEFYKEVIIAFEDHDWDTQDECLGEDKAFTEAIKELHPDWKI
jgi:hypothetical protein